MTGFKITLKLTLFKTLANLKFKGGLKGRIIILSGLVFDWFGKRRFIKEYIKFFKNFIHNRRIECCFGNNRFYVIKITIQRRRVRENLCVEGTDFGWFKSAWGEGEDRNRERFYINTGLEIESHLIVKTSCKGSLLEFSNSKTNWIFGSIKLTFWRIVEISNVFWTKTEISLTHGIQHLNFNRFNNFSWK